MTLKNAALVALVAALSSVAGYTLYHSRVAITPMIMLKSLLAPIQAPARQSNILRTSAFCTPICRTALG